MKNICIIFSAMILFGCVSKDVIGLQIKAATSVSITIWGASQTPIFSGPQAVDDQTMTNVAEKHCQKYNKHARRSIQRFVNNSGGGESSREFTYDCI